jgi:hypothetical protein
MSASTTVGMRTPGWRPLSLDTRIIDSGEAVSFTLRPAAIYPQEDSCNSFLVEAESTAGL